jgi:hypothetical protein
MKYTTDRNRSETSFLLLTAVIMAGIVIGALYSSKGQFTGSPWLGQYFIHKGDNAKALTLFLHTASSSVFFLMSVFLCGTSAVGQPLSLALLLYRGFGAGLSATCLYGGMGIKAVPAVMILLLPKAAVMLIAALLAVRESIRSSCRLAGFLINGECSDDNKSCLRMYLIRFMVLASLSILISAGDALLYQLMDGLLRI